MSTIFRETSPCPLLTPLPAVLVSCAGADGRPNLITIAWAGVVNSKPPMLSISIRPERFSYGLIAETGEFVVNLMGGAQAKALDLCGMRSGRDTDKFALSGLHPLEAPGMDRAPAVAESAAFLCCKVKERLPLGSHEMFVAEITAVRVRDELFDEDGSMHLERARLLTYSHGIYQKTGAVSGFFGWSLARPEVLERRMASYRGKAAQAGRPAPRGGRKKATEKRRG